MSGVTDSQTAGDGGILECDAFGCDETHPAVHDMLGEPCFAPGRWGGWVYLDANRPDLFPREMRFCGVACLEHWIWHQRRNKPAMSPLADRLAKIREEGDELEMERLRHELGVA